MCGTDDMQVAVARLVKTAGLAVMQLHQHTPAQHSHPVLSFWPCTSTATAGSVTSSNPSSLITVITVYLCMHLQVLAGGPPTRNSSSSSNLPNNLVQKSGGAQQFARTPLLLKCCASPVSVRFCDNCGIVAVCSSRPPCEVTAATSS